MSSHHDSFPTEETQRPFQRVGYATGLLSDTGFTSTIFEEMSALAQRYGALNLGQGFPDTDGPQEMMDAAYRAMCEGGNQYAPIAGLPVLRRAIAEHQRRFYGLEVDPDTQVLVTAGASEALASAIAALVNPGEEVVLFEPFYDIYPAAIAQAQAVVRTVPLLPPTFEPDLEVLEEVLSERTSLIVVNDPHNPTGAIFSLEVKRKIVELANRFDAVILTDSVYEHLVFEGVDYAPLQVLDGAAERTVAVSAISKTHSLTGWRVGWLTGPKELVEQIRLVKGYYSHSAAAPLQVGAAVGLGLGDEFYADFRRRYAMQRDLLLAGLSSSGFEVVAPQGTFFAAADVSGLLADRGIEDAAALARRLPVEAGVAVIPMTAFVRCPRGSVFSSWVRFAFCKRPEVLSEATERLSGWAAASSGR